MIPRHIELDSTRVVRQGRAILDVAELAVFPSEILAVVGPNGAGKSTLIQVMGLLLRPDRGSVRIDGELVTPAREHAARQRLACVFQSPHLLDRSVRANVELGMRLRGVPKAKRQSQGQKWLAALALEDLTDRRAKTLSGGEAQRVNLARALALGPEVLLLDEPLGGLDAPTRHKLMDELGPLIRRGAGSGVLVTHDRRVALALGDRVAVMLNGCVRQIGPPEEVFATPVDEEVAGFLGVENLLPAEVSGNTIDLGNKCVLCGKPEIEGKVTVGLRAEEVRLRRATEVSDEINLLTGTIIDVRRRGVGFAFRVDVGVELVGRLSRADRAMLDVEPGQRVQVRIRPEALHCIPLAR